MSTIKTLHLVCFIFSMMSISFTPCAKEQKNYELTPFVGYRFGGDFDDDISNVTIDLKEQSSFGLLTAWKYDRNRQGELLISHQTTEFEQLESPLHGSELSISYLHLGGNIQLDDGLVPLYFSGGFGITHISPDQQTLSNETNFSMNLGLSSRLKLTEQVKLFLGARVYGTFFDSESEIFCDSENCAIFVKSEVWLQSELAAGITFAF